MRHERQLWLDNIKGLAVLSVVLAHVANMYYDHGMYKECAGFFSFISNVMDAFMMPLFFIISGYSFGLAYVDRRDESNYRIKLKTSKVHRQMLNLFLVYVVWGVGYCFLKSRFSEEVLVSSKLSDILWMPVKAPSLFWYIYVLIICYIIIELCCKSKYGILVLFASSFILCIFQYWITDNGSTEYSAILISRYLLFFMMGFWCYIDRNIIDRMNSKGISVLMLCAGIIIEIFYWCFGVRNFKDNRFIWSDIPGWGMIIPILISGGLFLVAKLYNEKQILNLLGKYSLEIYLLHRYVMMIFRKSIPYSGIENGVLAFFVNVLITLSCCIAIAWLLRKCILGKLLFEPGRLIYETKNL